MKKFAILAVVLTFAGAVLAGCPPANNQSNKANTATTNGTNEAPKTN